MSITSKLVRHYASKVLRTRLQAEYDKWRRSGEPAGPYMRHRLPALMETVPVGDLNEVVERLRQTRAPRRELGARSADSASTKDLASNLAERAEAARERLAVLEARAEELEGQQDALEAIRSETDQRVEQLVDQARTESEQRVAIARGRVAELEERAASHVTEVERRARLAASSVVAAAEARYARAEAEVLAELDQARIDARVATERAEDAMERARVAAELFADTAEQASDESASLGDPRASLLRDVASKATKRASEAGRGRRRQARAGVALLNLEELDRDELYALAREVNLAGRSRLSKQELIDALSESR